MAHVCSRIAGALAAGAVLVAVSAPAARADEAQARAALDLAFRRATAEAHASPRLSFVETVAEKGVRVAARFDPVATRTWTPLAPPTSAQESKSLADTVRDTPDERDLLLDRIRASLSGAGTLVAERDGIATFDFAMAKTARPTGTLLDQVADLQSHIRVQLTVDEKTGTFTAMRFFAPQPFHATALAKVDHVDLAFTFGPSFVGGPTVVRQVATDVAYSIAGVACAVRDGVWFSDVAPRAGRAVRAGV
ncbi:MAG: hypothetical protein KJS97_16040 [Alphaproteobacteria bacterium]|nr:hypothetical protein [Alphaproteobacteria bacterium]